MSGLYSQDIKATSLYQEDNREGSGLGLIPTESRNPGLGIQVCVDSAEPGKFHADAITKGNSIFLSPGAEGLIRHEMGHVFQQRRGNVPSTRYVAGQQLNDSAPLEREAYRLGSMIPQQIVSKTLSSAVRGMSLQEAKGVVQCGKVEEENEVERLAVDLSTLAKQRPEQGSQQKKGSKKAQAEKKELDKKIEETKEKLKITLLTNYEGTDPRLVDALVQQIKNWGYAPMNPGLRAHLYRGIPIGDPVPGDSPLLKAGSGKMPKPDARPVSITATGLHAYSDIYDHEGKFIKSGALPPYIKPLGILGNQDQVHILYWAGKGGKSKFSTMLPHNMREGISKLLFEVGLASPVGSHFGEFTMGKTGDTIYPSGEGVGIGKTRGEVLGKKCDRKEEEMTLDEIFTEFNPDENEQKLKDSLPHLTGIGVYHELSHI